MDEHFVWRVMKQILLALHVCHDREEVILHRDLKVCVQAVSQHLPVNLEILI